MDIIYTLPNCPPAPVTIFAIPKPFDGHIGLIQYNAIASWTQLNPRPEIFLYGDEAGTKEICQKFGLVHIPQIERNEYGTPLLNGVFAETCDRATNEIIVYLNADIILMDDFIAGVTSCDRQLENYLLIGRRWDIDLDQQLKFTSNWQSSLIQLIKETGCLADYDCKDYFVFPRHLFARIPAFAVGRGYWDTWMVNHALTNNYPVVDCSFAITAIHQNHPYIHIRGGRNEAYMGREAQINKSLGSVTQPGNIACANWQLKPENHQRSPQISIVIVVKNDSDAVEKAVLSILIQDYNDCEIIVIDCREKGVFHDLKAYRPQVKYYSLTAKDKQNATGYGTEKASGEFVLFMGANSVLLPKVLTLIIDRFTQEASTLDVLLAGYRSFEKEEVTESLPWNDFPDLEKLYFAPSNVKKSLLDRSAIVFRAERAKFLLDLDLNPKQQMSEILPISICSRGCRVIWLKAIIKNYYV